MQPYPIKPSHPRSAFCRVDFNPKAVELRTSLNGYRNLLFFLPIGAAALWLHWRQGRVDKTAVRQFLPTGLLGALLGTGLAMLADESLLRRGFAVFLLLIGLRQLFPGKPKKKKTGPEA